MPSVKIRDNENFEFALRRFKRSVDTAGIITDLRAKEFYEKPTQVRKRKAAAAVKRTQKFVARNRINNQRNRGMLSR